MASPELVIGYHKLDTKFFTGYVQHTTIRSDAPQGRRRVKLVKKWYRDREIGRGSFGTVFLERSERGEYRAVKDIAKDKNSTVKIHYRRELMAMAILAKHDALFVQLFGWYESDDYVHIAMEYISHGHLRNYLKVERSENEAKAITRQLLEGLVVIHQEGFAHRDLKPENIFVVSTSPVWVKIGDFGLAKLARDGTAFRTPAFTIGYFAPEAGIATGGDSSEYTNAVDIWAVGCITHEMLTRVLPFRNFFELSLYCTRPEFPRNSMLLKNISRKGMEVVESMLALPPELRITAEKALNSEWLRLEDEGEEGLEIEDSAGPALTEVPAPSWAEVARRNSLSGNSKEGFHNRVAITVDVKDESAAEVLLLELRHRLQVGFLSKDPIDEEMPEMAKHFDMLESLGHVEGEAVRVGEQAAIDSIRLTDVAVLIQATKITEVLEAIMELASVPCDEEYQFRKRSTNLLQKWSEFIGLSSKNQLPTTSASPAVEKEEKYQNGLISAHMSVEDPEENVGMAVISRRRTKFLAVNDPSARTRISLDGQAEEASVSRHLDASSKSKPHANIDADVKRVLELVLKEIQKSTDSPNKPMLGDKDAVHMLISGVISMDIRDSAGNTTLHIAVDQLRQFDLDDKIAPSPLHTLVASGADINAKNSAGKTPLFLAVSHGSFIVARKLLELGANTEEPDLDGIPPLIAAVQQGNKTLVALLLNHWVFAGSSEVKQQPLTTLHAAAQLESDTICQFILRRGANVNVRDTLEQTPLHKAVIKKRLAMAGSLISAGAEIGARDMLQATALDYAVAGNSVPLVKLLLDHGANPDMVDKYGNSPRQAAVRANAPGMVAMFDRVRVTR